MTDEIEQKCEDADEATDKLEPGDEQTESPKRKSLRERANEPSDTVGTGSYAAIACSVVALAATVILILGLLLARWLF